MRGVPFCLASDYISYVPCDGLSFYYGYETVDEDENWCFKANALR